MPAPSELTGYSELVTPLRVSIRKSLPLSFQTQVFARADPAAGSAVNEYKTSLQLPGTHLGIHRAATHRLFIKHSLLYLESMKLSAVPGPIRTQGCLIIMILSLLYVATKLFLQT